MKDKMKRFNLKFLIPVLILVLGGIGAKVLIATKPLARKKAPVVAAPLVRIVHLKPQTISAIVEVMGSVTPASKVKLNSQVSGKVVSISDNFMPGGFFKKGETILQIDPLDYKLKVREQEAALTEAEYNYKIELGSQVVAKREWDLLKKSSGGTKQNADLALRKPHLQKVKSNLLAAKAKLEQAKIDLSRTAVKAPFSAMVLSKDTDVGSTLSVQENVGTIVGTDEFWVMVSVPVDKLDKIEIPSIANNFQGSTAKIFAKRSNKGSYREGRVLRLLPSLESKGRMARVIVAVDDPLNLQGKEGVDPLLIDSYVSVFIDSGEIKNVFAFPRSLVREGGVVWVMNDKDRLEIRKLNPVWKDSVNIYAKTGFKAGEKIVSSEISAPLKNMKLRERKETSRGEK